MKWAINFPKKNFQMYEYCYWCKESFSFFLTYTSKYLPFYSVEMYVKSSTSLWESNGKAPLQALTNDTIFIESKWKMQMLNSHRYRKRENDNSQQRKKKLCLWLLNIWLLLLKPEICANAFYHLSSSYIRWERSMTQIYTHPDQNALYIQSSKMKLFSSM